MQQEFETAMDRALAGLGYTRERRRLFRPPWSTSTIDHRVSQSWKTRFGARIQISVSLRHAASSAFAVSVLDEFTEPHLRFPLPDSFHSFIGFDLGRFCSWPIPWSLDPVEMGIDSCVGTVVTALQEKVFPMIGGVGDEMAMYGFVTQVANENAWPPNPAARALVTVFLGKRLGYAQSKVFEDILPFRDMIRSQIRHDASVDDFLAFAWSRA